MLILHVAEGYEIGREIDPEPSFHTCSVNSGQSIYELSELAVNKFSMEILGSLKIQSLCRNFNLAVTSTSHSLTDLPAGQTSAALISLRTSYTAVIASLSPNRPDVFWERSPAKGRSKQLIGVRKACTDVIHSPVSWEDGRVLIPSKANRVRFPAGPAWIFARGNSAAGRRLFFGDIPFPLPLHSAAAPYSPHFTFIGSQDHDVKSTDVLKRCWRHRTSLPLVDQVNTAHPNILCCEMKYGHRRNLSDVAPYFEKHIVTLQSFRNLFPRNWAVKIVAVLRRPCDELSHFKICRKCEYVRSATFATVPNHRKNYLPDCIRLPEQNTPVNLQHFPSFMPVEPAAAAELLDCSPPTKANWVQSPAGSLPVYWVSSVPPALAFQRCSILTSSALMISSGVEWPTCSGGVVGSRPGPSAENFQFTYRTGNLSLASPSFRTEVETRIGEQTEAKYHGVSFDEECLFSGRLREDLEVGLVTHWLLRGAQKVPYWLGCRLASQLTGADWRTALRHVTGYEVSIEQSRNERAGGNGRSQIKPADQQHCPARFPHAKIQGLEPGSPKQESCWQTKQLSVWDSEFSAAQTATSLYAVFTLRYKWLFRHPTLRWKGLTNVRGWQLARVVSRRLEEGGWGGGKKDVRLTCDQSRGRASCDPQLQR
ncbi:hypothetical protein PR048_017072 [Dryococelus australis]|uniref:Uncharacterized protein n=1 Tax=Dryococelus australis TaxID=614101 RepID=A0ABQ9H8I9_9NEOP|nr:hypothetical protein PR048_017072 [Dryococelus australis]